MRTLVTLSLVVMASLFVQGLTAQTVTVTGSLSAFSTTAIGVASAEQSYSVSGASLTADIVITPPTGFQISLTSGSGFATTAINLAFGGGTVASTTIFVVYNPPAAGPHSGNITHTSTGATQQDQAASGTITPAVTLTGSLTAFTTTAIAVASSEQSYSVAGANLTADIVITPPTGFQISLTSGSGFATTAINLTPTTGTVASTTIFVVYNPPAAGPHSGNITHTSTGATQQDQAASGSITPSPSVTLTGSLSAFSTTAIGVASSEQSYSVSGANLTADIVITPPTGFQISLTSGSGFATTAINLAFGGGTVASTTIFVVYNPPAAGPHSGNISHTSTGATAQSQAVSGSIAGSPVVSLTGSLSAFSTTGIGIASSEQSYSVSGTDLTADIVITPPTGFQIGTTTGVLSTSAVTLTQSGGTVSSTTIFVAYNPPTGGPHSGNISHTSTGASAQNQAVSGSIAGGSGQVTFSAAPTHPSGAQTASPGNSKSALVFRLTETAGSSFDLTAATVSITMSNNGGGVAATAVASVSISRGGTLATITNGGAGWAANATTITLSFTFSASTIAASGTGDFAVTISFVGGAAPKPAPGYIASLSNSNLTGSGTVTNTLTVTGGQITLNNTLPSDPFAEDDEEDSCSLSTNHAPSWPLLLILMMAAASIAAIKRRKA